MPRKRGRPPSLDLSLSLGRLVRQRFNDLPPEPRSALFPGPDWAAPSPRQAGPSGEQRGAGQNNQALQDDVSPPRALEPRSDESPVRSLPRRNGNGGPPARPMTFEERQQVYLRRFQPLADDQLDPPHFDQQHPPSYAPHHDSPAYAHEDGPVPFGQPEPQDDGPEVHVQRDHHQSQSPDHFQLRPQPILEEQQRTPPPRLEPPANIRRETRSHGSSSPSYPRSPLDAGSGDTSLEELAADVAIFEGRAINFAQHAERINTGMAVRVPTPIPQRRQGSVFQIIPPGELSPILATPERPSHPSLTPATQARRQTSRAPSPSVGSRWASPAQSRWPSPAPPRQPMPAPPGMVIGVEGAVGYLPNDPIEVGPRRPLADITDRNYDNPSNIPSPPMQRDTEFPTAQDPRDLENPAAHDSYEDWWSE